MVSRASTARRLVVVLGWTGMIAPSLGAEPAASRPILVYSTYLGGNSLDLGAAVAVDPAGNAYVTGTTQSGDFPVTGGSQVRSIDAFVTKLSPRGSLVWSTFFGGASIDEGHGITLDKAGNIYLTGFTDSPDFPSSSPGPRPAAGPFVAKLSPEGSILYSRVLGTGDLFRGSGIAVDSRGFAYVVGEVGIGSGSFLLKIDPAGSPIGRWDWGPGEHAVAVDAADSVYATGVTRSCPGFPDGDPNTFVLKLDPNGAQLYQVCFGGDNFDLPHAVAADPAGNAYVLGITRSSDFPVLHAFQERLAGNSDAFIVKLSPGGSFVYATYFGGRRKDQPLDIDVDAAGGAYVTGSTSSTDFPLADPVQGSCLPADSLGCLQDVFVARLTPDGAGLAFSSFLGGTSAADYGHSIAVDPAGNILLAGTTDSADFPTVNAFRSSGEGLDAFVAKIALNRPPVCSAAFATPATLWPPNGKLVPIAIRGVTEPDGDPVTFRVTDVRQDEPLSRQGQPDALGIGASIAQLRSDRTGGGDGRVYRIAFEASDGNGGVCTGTVTVCVPHDQGRGRTCGDGGPLFSSGG